MIAALGYCLLIAFGQKNQNNSLNNKVLRPHKVKKNEISIFSFGLKFLQYLLKYDRGFSFNLAFNARI